MMRILLAVLLIAGCRPAAGPPDLQISDAWARATVPGQTATAVYATIANHRDRADTLISVTAPVPARASLHSTSYEGGIARMRPIEGGLEIPPGEVVALKPGGAHIMVEQLAEPLRTGEPLHLTLRFSRSGERQLNVAVRDAASSGPGAGSH